MRLPMFPLGTVLFPSAFLPLHIFEPRYRQLVDDCLASSPEFGVVLIERGSEVGGGEVRTDVGTIARIVEATQLPDGRWALGAVGSRRIQVERWLPDDPYPLADVREWPDPPDAGLAERVAATVGPLRRALALQAELGEAAPPATIELADDAVLASYQASVVAPIGPLDRQRLLAAPTAAERLALLDEMLVEVVAVLDQRLAGG